VVVRSDTGIPKGNSNQTRVRIIGGMFDGNVIPATQVLPAPWEVFGKHELEDGEGAGEFETGTRCRIIRLWSRNTNPEYVLDALFEYNGRQWLPVEEGEQCLSVD